MSLTVKAFLQKDGKWDAEIRRFQVPTDVSSSFAYLSKKLTDIFPSLTAGNFSVFWKDSDGDHVSFSTDEELMEALGYVNDGIFKIYLILNNSTGRPDNDVVHPGVVCDGCQGAICGPRFKCLVCPDYDLCKACESRGMHVEHDMMKINVPGTFPAFPGFPGFPPFGGPGPHGPPGAGPHGGPHGPHGQFAPPPHFRRWMQKFMRRWHNKNAPGWTDGEKAEGKDGETMEQDTEKDQDSGEASGEEFLRSVGETVSAMLDPLGIDVDVSVDPPQAEGDSDEKAEEKADADGKDCRGGKWRGGRGRGGRGGRGRCGRGGHPGFAGCSPWDMYGFMTGCPMAGMAQGQWQWGPPGQGKPCGEGEGKCKRNKGKGKKCERSGDETEVPKQAPQSEKAPESQDKMDTESQEPRPQEKDTWTLLNMNGSNGGPSSGADTRPKPQEPQPGATAPPQQTEGALYPQLPSDPKIAEALQQMQSMGFTNEGGWLTNLLEAKNGDIVQVLDAIRPQRSRTGPNGTMA